MIRDYYVWLINNSNALYVFITFLLISGIAFILVYICIFIDYVIDKFKTIDQLSLKIEKLEKRKK